MSVQTQLTALHLSHFRSHGQTRLSFQGPPVALIGPNGAGKTNVLEAISLLSPGRGLRRAEPGDWPRRPEALGWKITAGLNIGGQSHEVETGAGPEGGARFLRVDGKAAAQSALGQMLRVLWLVPAMDRLWTEGAEARRRFLDRMALGFFPQHGEAVLTYEKAMRERNRLLKDQVEDGHWYDALERQMAAAGAVILAQREAALDLLAKAEAPEGSAGESAGAFPRAALSLHPGEGGWEGDLAGALAAGRRRDLAAGRTLIGPHRADLLALYAEKGEAAADCSTGEQKALLISLILAQARALTRAWGSPPLLLLDEVAAHLDEGRRAALYRAIETLGAQAIMTGTEAHLFDTLGAGHQMFRLSLVDGQSQVEEGAG